MNTDIECVLLMGCHVCGGYFCLIGCLVYHSHFHPVWLTVNAVCLYNK